MTKREQREICAKVCPSSDHCDWCKKNNWSCKEFWMMAYEREHKRVIKLSRKPWWIEVKKEVE